MNVNIQVKQRLTSSAYCAKSRMIVMAYTKKEAAEVTKADKPLCY
jgi:hypothetical protein